MLCAAPHKRRELAGVSLRFMEREADRQRGKLCGEAADTSAESAAATPLASQPAAESTEEQAREELISLRRRMYELDLDSAAESLPIG